MARKKTTSRPRERVIPFPGSRSIQEEELQPALPPVMEALLNRIVFGKPFGTLEEANAFFEELRGELMRMFLNSQDDPDSLESLIARARLEEDPAESQNLLKQVVEAGRQRLPDEFFEGLAGSEYLPDGASEWLEAKLLLAERARVEGSHEESVQHFEDLYRVTPNREMREALIAAYLAVGNTEAAGPLLERCSNGTMKWFASALYEHLRGDLSGASMALLRARKGNRFLRDYLSGERPMPQQPSFSEKPGSRGEANYCMFRLVPAWAAHPEATHWLERQ